MAKMTAEKAREMMGNGFHCSQIVRAYGASLLGMDENEALRLSAGLGGGCYNGDSCGAVSAAAFVLSIKYGYDFNTADVKGRNTLLVNSIREFTAKFKEKYRYTLCRELLGYDQGIPEDRPKIKENHATKNCPDMIEYACGILDEMLAE